MKYMRDKNIMYNLNLSFFEEFKHLDKLCGEIYNTNNGITHYIEDMKAKGTYSYGHIPGWESDLKHLIQYRHIRNHMAHSEGAFEIQNCTQKDIDWIRNFYERIMNQSDPLGMLYHKPKNHIHKQTHTYQQSEKSNAKEKNKIALALMVVVFTLLAVCGVLIYMFITV